MAADADRLRRDISAAHAEALHVHDSPVRADRLYREVERISGTVEGADLTEEQTARIRAALADAMRVLRRDDDGREAAKHLQTALGQLEQRERRPFPFLDDV